MTDNSGTDFTVPPDLKPARMSLVGVDGNAFAVMGAVSARLRIAGNSDAIIARYRAEAMRGDYDHLLRVSLAYTDDSGVEDDR